VLGDFVENMGTPQGLDEVISKDGSPKLGFQKFDWDEDAKELYKKGK
jgi:hypothetical protein